MKSIGLIGRGPWGQRYSETFAKYFPGVELQVAGKNDWENLLDKKIGGVIICTPPTTHVDLAVKFLEKEIPTIIEKPLALSSEEIKKLEPFNKIPILVNYIHLFSSAFKRLKNNLAAQPISDIKSVGCNFGPFRNYSSLWDYGPHDIAMSLYLSKKLPKSVTAFETKYEYGSIFDIDLDFGTFNSNIKVGNGSQRKIRTLEIKAGGIKQIYNDAWLPETDDPPLKNMLDFFNGLINEKCCATDVGLDLSIQVTKILEACEKSIKISSTIDYTIFQA